MESKEIIHRSEFDLKNHLGSFSSKKVATMEENFGSLKMSTNLTITTVKMPLFPLSFLALLLSWISVTAVTRRKIFKIKNQEK